MIGNTLYQWLKELFPICRSITGKGTLETLQYLQRLIPGFKINSVPSGYKAFDWTVPDEWNIYDAYVANSSGIPVIDFSKNNLHVVGYSIPVNKKMTLSELKPYLYSLPDNPEAIPYLTSYYERIWGFCISDKQKQTLKDDTYHVVIDSTLKKGRLNYGEIIIKGKTDKEILLSTYVCHPSLANNELSGPVVTAALAQYIQSIPNRHYTYRIIFVPETIGSLVYLSKHWRKMKRKTVAGFVVTCVGDENKWSFVPSRSGKTLADRAAKCALKDKFYDEYSFLDRGSDERQYCSPLIDLPVCSVMRSKYGEYKEYHNSLDNLDFVSPNGLEESCELYTKMIDILEKNCKPLSLCKGEPQLGKRGLYLTTKNIYKDIMAYSDGKTDLITMAELFEVDFSDVYNTVQSLLYHKLIRILL